MNLELDMTHGLGDGCRSRSSQFAEIGSYTPYGKEAGERFISQAMTTTVPVSGRRQISAL